MEHHSRTIVNIDLDAFYVQCVLKQQPHLRGKPLGIVQKYLVVTCSYEARARGVGKLQRTEAALAACPDLVLVDGSDLTWFRRCSRHIHKVLLAQCAALVPAGSPPPPIEKLVMEEFWIDVSSVVDKIVAPFASTAAPLPPLQWPGHVHGYQAPNGSTPVHPTACPCGCVLRLHAAAQIASSLRRAVLEQLQFTTSSGISCSKQGAKIASGLHKPNDQTTLFPWLVRSLLQGRNVGDLPGIGWHTNQKLVHAGVKTMEQLLSTPTEQIAAIMDVDLTAAQAVQDLARGIDNRPVIPSGSPVTVSAEDTFKACTTWEDAVARMRQQCSDLVGRLVEDHAEYEGRHPRTLRLSIRHGHWTVGGGRHSRQVPYPPSALIKADSTADQQAKALDTLMANLLPLLRQLIAHPHAGSAGAGGAGAQLPAFHLTAINVGATGFPDAPIATEAGQKKVASYFTAPKAKAQAAQSADDDVIVVDDEETGEEHADSDLDRTVPEGEEVLAADAEPDVPPADPGQQTFIGLATGAAGRSMEESNFLSPIPLVQQTMTMAGFTSSRMYTDGRGLGAGAGAVPLHTSTVFEQHTEDMEVIPDTQATQPCGTTSQLDELVLAALPPALRAAVIRKYGS